MWAEQGGQGGRMTELELIVTWAGIDNLEIIVPSISNSWDDSFCQTPVLVQILGTDI